MEYESWNRAIGESLFCPDRAGELVYLAIDRETIETIALNQTDGRAIVDAVGDFVMAVRMEIDRSGWHGHIAHAAKDGIPGFVGLLAAQVVAAFDMCDDGEYTANAYWGRLNQLLKAEGGYRRPLGLDARIHQKLWKSLRHWANDLQGGRLGRVRLADTRDTHKHIALPLGHCLLRRVDLDRLRELFQEDGRTPYNRLSRDELRNLIDESRDSHPKRYFSRHAIAVLDDCDRYEDAFEQIITEYDRFLKVGRSSNAGARPPQRSSGDSSPPRTAIWLRRGKELSGGLCELRGDRRVPDPKRRSLADVLDAFYFRRGREQFDRSHKPPRDDRLLAVWSEEEEAFVETRRASPGDRAILLVSAFDRSEWINQVERLAVPGTLRRFLSPEETDRAAVAKLRGLPPGWFAFEFEFRENLSGEQFGPDWEGMLTRETYLRTDGGLLLTRRRWMAGAGPVLRVIGAERPEVIWIDDKPYALDENGRVSSRVAPVLDRCGGHRAWLPGKQSLPLKFVVVPARIGDVPGNRTAWRRTDDGWPTRAEDLPFDSPPDSDYLQGPRLVGTWRACAEVKILEEVGSALGDATRRSESRVAVDLLLRLRSGITGRDPYTIGSIARTATTPSMNPLIRALANSQPRNGQAVALTTHRYMVVS